MTRFPNLYATLTETPEHRLSGRARAAIAVCGTLVILASVIAGFVYLP